MPEIGRTQREMLNEKQDTESKTLNDYQRGWTMRSHIIPTVMILAVTAALVLSASCSKETSQKQAESPGKAPQASHQPETSMSTRGSKSTTGVSPGETAQPGKQVGKAEQLPRLVDLGRGTCIPCKMMAPILEELKKEYQGRVVVDVIDLRDDPGAARTYGIRVIPTQIFYDAAGKEIWRHEGFLSKDAIVAKLAEMGVEAP